MIHSWAGVGKFSSFKPFTLLYSEKLYLLYYRKPLKEPSRGKQSSLFLRIASNILAKIK